MVVNASNATVEQKRNVVPMVPMQLDSTGTHLLFTSNLENFNVMPQTVTIVETKLVPSGTQVILSRVPRQIPSLKPPNFTSAATFSQLQVIQTQQLPTVLLRPPSTPKSYRGDASYKAYKEYFEHLIVSSGCMTPLQKAQNLVIALEGPAAETVWGMEIKHDEDYKTIWALLNR